MSTNSPGPWHSEVTMSSDFRHIRRIADHNGVVIADVRYVEGAEQDQNLANAKLLAAAPVMHEALLCALAVLQSMPEIDRGNSKAHFIYHQVRAALSSAAD